MLLLFSKRVAKWSPVLGKSCLFGFLCVSFVNVYQFLCVSLYFPFGYGWDVGFDCLDA